MPVAIDDPRPMVRAQVIADVHIGHRVAIELVAVVKRVAKSDQRSQHAVEGKEAAKQGGDGGLRSSSRRIARFLPLLPWV